MMNLFTEPTDRAKAMGIFGFVASGGGSLGVLLGGVLTDALDWHWIFLVNLPIGIAVVALTMRLLPAGGGQGGDAQLDVAGAVTVTTALMIAVYAIVNGNDTGWLAAQTVGMLAVAALLFAIVFAIPLGILAAVFRGTAVDHAAMTISLVGISMPNFWLGPLLAILFAVRLGWLPVSGIGGLSHLILPAVTLGAALSAILARMTRASVLEELRELYVLAARARGLSGARAVLRHAFRNSLIPIVTIVGLQFGAVLTGTIITETIFAWPGIGRLLIQAINFRDYPLVQGCILFISITYVTMNLLTDLTYGFLDPRIRFD
jgi:ABC-type dipeptide/oligopeptide/nickel transport system permease subunit